MFADHLPQMYARDGKFLAAFGRPGAGPGELQGRMTMLPLPGDSVLVVEQDLARASVFAIDGRFERQIQLPGIFMAVSVLHWPDSVLMAGLRHQGDRLIKPLHMVSLSKAHAEVMESGGLTERYEPVAESWLGVAASERGPWWTIRRPYRLSAFDTQLQLVRTLERTPDWWTEDPDLAIGIPHKTPPHPGVNAVGVDGDGLLWVFLRVAAPTWREAWSRVPIGATEIASRFIDYDKLYLTMVEVIDPATARVIARGTLNLFVIAALTGRRAVAYTYDADGFPEVRIIELDLKGTITIT